MFDQDKIFSSFSVNDLEVAKKFYGETLGLPAEQNEMGVLDICGGRFMIYPKPNHVAADFTVLNFMVDDMEMVVDGLTSKGVKFEQYDSEWIKTDAKGIADQDGRKMAWFTDPAGNILSLIKDV